MTAQLRREVFVVHHKPVARIMREESLQCQLRRRFVVTTESAHGLVVYANLIRNLAVSGMNEAEAEAVKAQPKGLLTLSP